MFMDELEQLEAEVLELEREQREPVEVSEESE